MSTPQAHSRYPLGLFAVALSAAVFYVSSGLGTLWPLTWVAPLPVLVVAFQRSGMRAAFMGPAANGGVEICKDLDFPAWSRVYGRRGVRFLAVPAWDFVDDARPHARMAVVRGVENGFTIARSAQHGLVTLSDSHGRILGEQSSATDPILVIAAPPGAGTTLYARFGDWFGWAAVVCAAALLIGAIASGAPYRRVRGSEHLPRARG